MRFGGGDGEEEDDGTPKRRRLAAKFFWLPVLLVAIEEAPPVGDSPGGCKGCDLDVCKRSRYPLLLPPLLALEFVVLSRGVFVLLLLRSR